MFLCLFLSCSVMDKAVSRNVAVETEDYIGAGVILETGLVLTNFHLLGTETYVNGKLAEVLKVDKVKDLALLKVATPQRNKVKFSVAHRGESIFYVGNPSGHLNSVSQGHVVYMDSNETITDTLPVGGMSGGGLYNRKGELVGIDEGFEGNTQYGFHLTVHIPIQVVREFLGRDK